MSRPKLGPPLPRNRLGETAEQLEQRRKAVVVLVVDVFHLAVDHLGENDARLVWRAAAKAKRGRPKGTRNAERDQTLLRFYDAVAPTMSKAERKSLPRYIAMFAKERDPKTFPAVVASIEMQLRRLLKSRAKQERANSALYAQFLLRPPDLG